MQFVKPMTYREAVDFLGARSPIGSEMMSAEWQDVPVELRLRAMFSSEVESIRFLQRSRDWLGDFLSANREVLPDGQTALAVGGRAQFVEMARQFALSEGMGPLVPEDAGSIKDITSEKRLSLIFNVQTQQSDDYGYWRQGMNPDVLNEFPAQRFIRVKEVKQERESHVPYEDQVYLKTDPIWIRINADFGVPWGPWGWGCGHDVQDEDRQTAIAMGLMAPGEELVPETKLFNENLRASAAGLDPDLLAKLKGEFGEQLVIEGDELKWNPRTDFTEGNKGNEGPGTAIPSPQPSPPGEGVTAAVSEALDVRVKGSLLGSVRTAMAAIDQVHDDGVLPEVPLTGARTGALGVFRSTVAGRALGIVINRFGDWPALTTVHEVGHFLDMSGIGGPGYASLTGDPMMARVLAAADKTAAIKGLRNMYEPGHYFLRKQEIWARAYAQWIAERSGDARLTADLARALGADPLRQWTTEDFKPVAEEIDKMFKKLGWL